MHTHVLTHMQSKEGFIQIELSPRTRLIIGRQKYACCLETTRLLRPLCSFKNVQISLGVKVNFPALPQALLTSNDDIVERETAMDDYVEK